MFFKRCFACNFIKKRLQHRCFRTLFFTELLRWLLLREIDQISNSNKCCSLPCFPISLYNHYGPLQCFSVEVLQPKFPDVLFLMTINLLLSKPVKKNLKQLDNAYVFFKNYFRQIELICQVSGSEFKST